VVGTVDLEAGPSRSQNVGEERGNEVRDRLVQEGNNCNAHHPDPEGHESDVFRLDVVNSAQE